MTLAFRAFQAALNSALAVPKSEAEPAGSPLDGDGPEPAGRQALLGEADPTDALPAFEHGIVIDAERAELQHILGPFLGPSWGGNAPVFRARSQNPTLAVG